MSLEDATRRTSEQQRDVENAIRELANAIQTLVLSVEAYYHPPSGCHVRAEALKPVAQRVLRAAEDVTSALDRSSNP